MSLILICLQPLMIMNSSNKTDYTQKFSDNFLNCLNLVYPVLYYVLVKLQNLVVNVTLVIFRTGKKWPVKCYNLFFK